METTSKIQLNVAGHIKPLFVSPHINECGGIKDGLAFNFGNEGCWVIALEELRQLVKTADKIRENNR